MTEGKKDEGRRKGEKRDTRGVFFMEERRGGKIGEEI